MITWLRWPRLQAPPRPGLAFCEADQWSFDPRYTQGRCPICGWQPAGAAAAPAWLALANRLDWDMIGLFVFADVLILLGLVVANAAGLIPHHASLGVPPAPGGVASAPRTH